MSFTIIHHNKPRTFKDIRKATQFLRITPEYNNKTKNLLQEIKDSRCNKKKRDIVLKKIFKYNIYRRRVFKKLWYINIYASMAYAHAYVSQKDKARIYIVIKSDHIESDGFIFYYSDYVK